MTASSSKSTTPNKYNYNSYTRKKLGDNEKLILRYCVLVSRRFTISDIVTYYKKLSIALSNRRIWDSVQRLISKGFIKKLYRGIYELVKDIDMSLLSSVSDKENLYSSGVVGGGGRGSRGRSGVVRVHGNGGNVLDFYKRVYFGYVLLGCVSRRLYNTLLSSFGFSRSFLNRVKREVSRLSRDVCFVDGVVGCHGRYGYRKRFSGLKPVSLCNEFHSYEYGVDMFVDAAVVDMILDVIGKYFLKLYISI